VIANLQQAAFQENLNNEHVKTNPEGAFHTAPSGFDVCVVRNECIYVQ